MRRAVERYLEDPLAEELLRGDVKAGDIVEVVDSGRETRFHVPSRRVATASATVTSCVPPLR